MEDIHLLLVDDEAGFRAAIARRLERRGIRVFQAEDGPSCLDLIEKTEVSVVVLDVKMPGMSGIEVLKRIKERWPQIEVILLTGQASTADGVEGIKAGAFDYLTKPIEFEHLFEKVKQAHDRIVREAEKQRAAEFRTKMEQQMITTERLASLGTLAVGVAHEINNPLAIIQESVGWMRQLLDRKELSDFSHRPAFEKAIGKIETAVDRTRRITHQLLGFVKRQNSAATAVNLPELVEEAVELVRREVLKREIEIVKKIDTALTEIRSDPYQLRQVLINLLSNAVHATSAGGRITLIIEDWGDSAAIKVQDTGTGIPRENLDRIFEPFFSTKKPGQGTGLGLYVSRGIVEKLGGRIEVESQLGRGSVFSIRLPKEHPVETQLLAGDGMDIFSDTITSRE